MLGEPVGAAFRGGDSQCSTEELEDLVAQGVALVGEARHAGFFCGE